MVLSYDRSLMSAPAPSGPPGSPTARSPVPSLPMSDEEQIGYAEAMRELEEILDALEDDDLDVDVLATKVERASALIQLCRNRIGNARIQVEKVVASLDEPTEGVDTLFDDCDE